MCVLTQPTFVFFLSVFVLPSCCLTEKVLCGACSAAPRIATATENREPHLITHQCSSQTHTHTHRHTGTHATSTPTSITQRAGHASGGPPLLFLLLWCVGGRGPRARTPQPSPLALMVSGRGGSTVFRRQALSPSVSNQLPSPPLLLLSTTHTTTRARARWKRRNAGQGGGGALDLKGKSLLHHTPTIVETLACKTTRL